MADEDFVNDEPQDSVPVGDQQPAQDGVPEPSGGEPQVPEPQLSDAEKRLQSSIQSWMGRYVKKVIDDTKNVVRDEILQNLPPPQPQYQPQQFQPQSPPPDEIDPYTDFRGSVVRVLSEAQGAQQQYNQSVTNSAISIIRNDPFMRNDPEVQKEVWDVASKLQMTPNVDPVSQARLLISEAKGHVFATRASKKGTAFDGRTPTNQPRGGIGGTPTTASSKAFDMSSLDEDTRHAAKAWGYTAEQLTELFGK